MNGRTTDYWAAWAASVSIEAEMDAGLIQPTTRAEATRYEYQLIDDIDEALGLDTEDGDGNDARS